MNKRQNNEQIVQTFMNHCASIIQANFKGYSQQKYYRKFIPLYRRFKQLLYAGFVGWKTRKVTKLSHIKTKITQINLLRKQQKNMQVRIAKRDLSNEISRLLKNGMWIYYFLKEKKISLSHRQSSFENKKQDEPLKKTNLKHILNIIPKSNPKSKVQKVQNKQVKVIKVQKLLKQKEKQRQSEEIPEQIYKLNEKKSKKFQVPPKQSQNVTKKKLIKIQVQTSEQSESQQLIQHNDCQTPNNIFHQGQQFVFHTKPRYQSRSKNPQIKSSSEVQDTFRQIHVIGFSNRKGLNMTLSKKFADQVQNLVTQINQNVLQDFSKNKSLQKETEASSDKDSVLQSNHEKEVSDFGQPKKIQNVQLCDKKSLESRVNLSLQMQKDEFQKKKIEFQKRLKQPKNIILL